MRRSDPTEIGLHALLSSTRAASSQCEVAFDRLETTLRPWSVPKGLPPSANYLGCRTMELRVWHCACSTGSCAEDPGTDRYEFLHVPGWQVMDTSLITDVHAVIHSSSWGTAWREKLPGRLEVHNPATHTLVLRFDGDQSPQKWVVKARLRIFSPKTTPFSSSTPKWKISLNWPRTVLRYAFDRKYHIFGTLGWVAHRTPSPADIVRGSPNRKVGRPTRTATENGHKLQGSQPSRWRIGCKVSWKFANRKETHSQSKLLHISPECAKCGNCTYWMPASGLRQVRLRRQDATTIRTLRQRLQLMREEGSSKRPRNLQRYGDLFSQRFMQADGLVQLKIENHSLHASQKKRISISCLMCLVFSGCFPLVILVPGFRSHGRKGWGFHWPSTGSWYAGWWSRTSRDVVYANLRRWYCSSRPFKFPLPLPSPPVCSFMYSILLYTVTESNFRSTTSMPLKLSSPALEGIPRGVDLDENVITGFRFNGIQDTELFVCIDETGAELKICDLKCGRHHAWAHHGVQCVPVQRRHLEARRLQIYSHIDTFRMIPCVHPCRVLLLASGQDFNADILEACRATQQYLLGTWPCFCVALYLWRRHHNAGHQCLTRPFGLRSGREAFPHVFLLPRPRRGWWLGGNISVQDQSPAGLTAWILGTTPKFASNRHDEIIAWFTKQALGCSARKVVTMLRSAENLGGNILTGRGRWTSSWPSEVWMTRSEALAFRINLATLTRCIQWASFQTCTHSQAVPSSSGLAPILHCRWVNFTSGSTTDALFVCTTTRMLVRVWSWLGLSKSASSPASGKPFWQNCFTSIVSVDFLRKGPQCGRQRLCLSWRPQEKAHSFAWAPSPLCTLYSALGLKDMSQECTDRHRWLCSSCWVFLDYSCAYRFFSWKLRSVVSLHLGSQCHAGTAWSGMFRWKLRLRLLLFGRTQWILIEQAKLNPLCAQCDHGHL